MFDNIKFDMKPIMDGTAGLNKFKIKFEATADMKTADELVRLIQGRTENNKNASETK